MGISLSVFVPLQVKSKMPLLEDIQKIGFTPVSISAIALSIASLSLYVGSRRSSATERAKDLGQSGIPLPPGPPPELLIGNLRHIPKDHLSEGFSAWAKTYGESAFHFPGYTGDWN